MQQAIITGASGFIGARLAKFLSLNEIEVYALGRKKLEDLLPNRIKETKNLHYIQIDMNNIEELPNILGNIKNSLNDCVFFNFAWAGEKGLSDLCVQAQVNNAIWAEKAFKVSHILKCKKFVHVGTMEEAFGDAYLEMDYKVNNEYNRHVIYSIAKKTARDLLKSVAIKYSPDLIIVSKSHIMGPNDNRDSLLRVSLKKIIAGEHIEFTSGEQNFDVVSISDCVRAFKLIGEKGKKNSEYWVGSGEPRPLKEYINIMFNLYAPDIQPIFGKAQYNDVKLSKETFSPFLLNKDTGFYCLQTYEDAVKEMYEYLAHNVIIEDNRVI